MELTTEQLIKILLGVIVVAAVIFLLYNFSSNITEFFKTDVDDKQKTAGEQVDTKDIIQVQESSQLFTPPRIVAAVPLSIAGCYMGAKLGTLVVWAPVVGGAAPFVGCLIGGAAGIVAGIPIGDLSEKTWNYIKDFF
ncbi:hypothetical protein HY448_02215 [Candidatus Pacearchaeota archaeon]|nr:hypothetical protein [Candidatus Pacearchaeota archaeon]